MKNFHMKHRQRYFERIAVDMGLTDFTIGEDGRYENDTTRYAFHVFNAGWVMCDRDSGTHYVIGAIDTKDSTKTIKFGDQPVKHMNRSRAQVEQRRLAKKHKDMVFTLYSAYETLQFKDNKVRRTLTHDSAIMVGAKRALFYAADDGFGNMIDNQYTTRLNIYLHVFDNEISMDYGNRRYHWG